MLTQQQKSQLTTDSDRIYTYHVELKSKEDDDGYYDRTFSLQFPKPQNKPQIRTLLHLMGWLREYDLGQIKELDLDNYDDLNTFLE